MRLVCCGDLLVGCWGLIDGGVGLAGCLAIFVWFRGLCGRVGCCCHLLLT